MRNTDNEVWQVFLGTNVLISGIASRTGASSAILDLAEAEEIRAVLSRHVLVEADRVFAHKFPHLVKDFRLFIKNMRPMLLDDPAPRAVREAGAYIEAGDAPILAAVKTAECDYLVTLNTRHFKMKAVQEYVPVPIVTPAEFLMAFRHYWSG